VADRVASIRIPAQVVLQGYGYLEDCRPAANADPYVVSARILETVCSTARRLDRVAVKQISYTVQESIKYETGFI
jgi:glutamine synthetase